MVVTISLKVHASDGIVGCVEGLRNAFAVLRIDVALL